MFVVFIAVRRREFKGNILGLLRVGTVALALRGLCWWGASLDSPGWTRISLEGILAAERYSLPPSGGWSFVVYETWLR